MILRTIFNQTVLIAQNNLLLESLAFSSMGLAHLVLFVVAYNPKYIELHPDEFKVGEHGEYMLIKPELNPEANKQLQGSKLMKA